jgi:hypothetical protein
VGRPIAPVTTPCLAAIAEVHNGTNYQFFGGKSKFDEMVRISVEKTK